MASKKRRSSSKTAGITRVDQPSTRTHGFVVRLGWYQRKDGSYGPKHKSFFGDVSHGGKAGAMKAANSWLKAVSKGGKAPAKKKVARKKKK